MELVVNSLRPGESRIVVRQVVVQILQSSGNIVFGDAAGRIIEEAPRVEVREDAGGFLEGMNESGEIETNPKRLGGFGEPVDYDGVILGLVS